MIIKPHNPDGLFPQYLNHHHGVEVSGDGHLLFISGTNGYEQDGSSMPDSFEAQADLIWQYIGAILRSAGMGYENIVNLRIYLADPKYDADNMRMRKKYLGDHRTSLTVIACQLLETKWKLEIEAVAAK